MFFTPGNIITLVICLILVVLFRQLDKNNRSIEKVKKFGDKLKDDLDAFIKERTAKLEESSVTLEVQQAKAVAAVKRLESIREELSQKEQELLTQTNAVSDFGNQIAAYDTTIKQLMEMTALAQTNLEKITSESDFADSLGKKLMASQKQLAQISAAIPALQEQFSEENKRRFESVQADTIARISDSVSDLNKRIDEAQRDGEELIVNAADKLKTLYQKAFAEASHRADSLEGAAFAKLKEQAAERLQRYKEQIDERTATLHEQTKTKLQETQQLVKSFKGEWQTEANDYLEATRAEIRQLSTDYDATLSQLDERVKSAESLLDTRSEQLNSQLHEFEASLSSSIDEIAAKTGTSLAGIEENTSTRISAVSDLLASQSTGIQDEIDRITVGNKNALADITAETESAISNLGADLDKKLQTAADLAESRHAELEERITLMAAELEKSLSGVSAGSSASLESLSSEINASVAAFEEEFRNHLRELSEGTEMRITAITDSVEAKTAELDKSSAEKFSSISMQVENEAAKITDATTEKITEMAESIESRTAELEKILDEKNTAISDRLETESARITEYTNATLTEINNLVDTQTVALGKNLDEKTTALSDRFDTETARIAEDTRTKLESVTQHVNVETEKLAAHTDVKLTEITDLVNSQTAALENTLDEKTAAVSERLNTEIAKLSENTDTSISEITGAVETVSAQTEQKLVELTAKTDSLVTKTTESVEQRLESYAGDVGYRLSQFDSLIGDAEQLDAQLRIAMQNTEKRVTDGFDHYMQEQEGRQDTFEKKLNERDEVLSSRMQTLENELNELKTRAYENVSAKLKVFEDDFFGDLSKRSDNITAALERWKTDVDERLESLSAESESARKDTEAAYTLELKERLANIAEQYRGQTAKLEEQISAVENELRSKITASDQSILTFVEQFRSEFAQALETANLHTQNELDAQTLAVQETMRTQQREVDTRTREFLASIENARTESETVLEGIRNDFAAWQSKNEQQFAEAGRLFEEKLTKFDADATRSMADVEAGWQTNYRDFTASTAEERQQLADSVESLKNDLAAANVDFDKRLKAALAEFNTAYEEMNNVTERTVRETNSETEKAVRLLKTQLQEIRGEVEDTKATLFQKIQADTGSLGQTLEEIDRKQKAFIAQTRIFDRADELKAALESGIESLKNELSRLDVYRDTMNTLEQQYTKVRKLDEEATQKVTRFMTEKKRIDILETDFGKLLGLSDSIDKKISELTVVNDDLQQSQVQIRRFEESIADANTRYDRLEKKSAVLDQTVTGIDKAFENLKELETAVSGYRSELAGVPAQLETMKQSLDTLLENREKTAIAVEKLGSLDDVLSDIEKRMDKMQSSREWLARTETRLDEVSKQSQDQLKLLGDLLKEESPAKKTRGAPPIGVRENVVKLAHQGWKVDEIARALHLSRGEVELILELPQN